MAKQLQLRQGTTTEHNTFKGAVGEVTVDTTKDTLVVHDGVTVGGHPIASKANADGTISLIKKDGTSAGTIDALGLFNNTLTSTNTNQALTAAQGKVLKDLINSSAFGVGQTWQNVTSSRLSGTVYTNTTGKTIIVKVSSGYTSSGNTMYLYVDGNEVQQIRNDAEFGSVNTWATLEVPSGATYQITSSASFTNWSELR